MIKGWARAILKEEIGMYEQRIGLLKESLHDQKCLVSKGVDRENKLREKVWELRHVIEDYKKKYKIDE